MKLTYLGQCGFLIEVGGARLVTDPYLSDFIDARHADEPDGGEWKRNYPAPCTLAELQPDCVLISHSHDDHMDPWTLTRFREAGGDCPIAAPAPECAPLEEMGFTSIIYARAEQAFVIKGLRVTPIMCGHTQPHTDDMGRFRELSYIIESEGKRVFFGGDLSLYDGLTRRLVREHVDYAILPCNGRDDDRTSRGIIGNTDCAEAAKLAAECGATLIPSHYDLYDGNGCAPEEIRAAAHEAGVRLLMPEPGKTIMLE